MRDCTAAENFYSYPSFYNVHYPAVFADNPAVGAWLGLAPALQDESWTPYNDAASIYYPDIVPASNVLGLGFVGGGRRATGRDGIQRSNFMSYDEIYRAFAWAADYHQGDTWIDDRTAGMLIFPVSDYPEPGSIFTTALRPDAGQSIRCVED